MSSEDSIIDKFAHGKGLFTFLRSTVAAQIGSWVDMGTFALCFSVLFRYVDDTTIRNNLAVAMGAVFGGIINCTLNYRYTFHASGQSVKAVAVKYILVWIGSLLFNMYGTLYMGECLSRWQWLREIGFKLDGIYTASRLLVSLIVSLGWNFQLQRLFVYRPSRFDPVAIRVVNLFCKSTIKK